jgi:hypothetical protein
MKGLIQTYRRFFPRRRRLWRYVSPRRRGLALVVLAMLMVATYGYGRLTHDARVRRRARSYLRELTGGRVEIGRAHFGLFSGVHLYDVKVYPPGQQSAEPFFKAKTVLLRYKPTALLLTGTLQPAEVICLEPLVTLEHDVQRDRYNFQDFFPAAGQVRPRRTGLETDLPPIRVRHGRLRWVDVEGGMRVPFEEMPITLSMTPGPNGEYLITFEEQQPSGGPGITGRLSLDVTTGQVRLLSGTVPIPNLDKALPGKYRQWRQRYGIRGEVRLVGSADQSGQGPMECRLEDVSLVLPAEEGGLELAHVTGTVLFDEAGVTLRDVGGQVPGAGEAAFTLSGRYEGYEADSPFRLTVRATSLSLPEPAQAGGQLASLLEVLVHDYGLAGRCHLSVDLWRQRGGDVDFRATAQPQGMSATYRYVPYRLEDIRGEVAITPAGAELRTLRGQRHGARFDIDGVIVPAGGTGNTCLTIGGKDVLLDRELRDAMPSAVQSAWDALDPSGRLSANVKITCGGRGNLEHVEGVVEMTGQTSVRPRDFPYRVDSLIGRTTIRDGDVVVEDVRGSRGVMSCLVGGRIVGAGSQDGNMDLTIEARRLPIDEDLAAALPAPARRALESLHPAGWAERVHCHLRQTNGGQVHYQAQATVGDLSFESEVIPCRITNGRGDVEIDPGLVTINDLTGVCGQGRVVIAGQALLKEEEVGLDLIAKATQMPMDERLLAALPTDLAGLRKKLSVSGLADVDLSVRSALWQGQAADYRLRICPQDMQVKYEGLPSAWSGVRGTVQAAPGRIEIDNLTAEEGSMQLRMDGVITSTVDALEGDVSLKATDLPISRELVAALPAEVGALMKRLADGGSCDVDLRKLAWRTPRASLPTTSPASSPADAASAPARQGDAAGHGSAFGRARVASSTSEPVKKSAWELVGNISLKGAVVDLDFGQRTLSGTVSGRAASTGGELTLETDISLSEVDLGQRRVNDVSGRLVKPAGATVIRVEDLSARVHGGKAAGFAEIALSSPLRYGIRLSVEDLDVHELFHSSTSQPSSQPVFDVRGLLTGNLQMTATVGEPRTRQASGVLKITRARIRQLPVVWGLIHVIYLWLPGQGTFAEGDVTYRLEGEELIFEEISLRGPAMSVLGSGRVNLKDETLHLTFLTGPPGHLPRIAGLGDLLRGLSREIAEVRVTGTLTHPLPQTVSLPGLDDAVRRLLSPESLDED